MSVQKQYFVMSYKINKQSIKKTMTLFKFPSLHYFDRYHQTSWSIMILMILLLANISGLSFSPTHLYGKYHQEGHPPEVTEPGEDCRKFTRFHESLRKAGSSFDQTCVDTSPICKYYNFSKKDI